MPLLISHQKIIQMILVCRHLLLLSDAELLQESIMEYVGMPFKIAADLEFLRGPHREEFLQRGQTVESNSSPLRRPSPANKWQARLASRCWHPGANEGDGGTFVRRDALRLVKRQGPGETKRQIHTHQRLTFVALHLGGWNWNPRPRQTTEDWWPGIFRKINDNKTRQRAIVEHFG